MLRLNFTVTLHAVHGRYACKLTIMKIHFDKLCLPFKTIVNLPQMSYLFPGTLSH